jgi:hypothetical protein
MAPPIKAPSRSIVMRPKKQKHVFAITGYLGIPGTGMKIMTIEQLRKCADKRAMKMVMRLNASSRPSLCRDTE